jgi:hypothetical protein
MLTAEQEIALRARFPHAFLLRGFPGDTFRVSCMNSYVNEDGVLMIYTQRWDAAQQTWLDFAKGTDAELQREIVPSRVTALGMLEPLTLKKAPRKPGRAKKGLR